MPQAITYFLEIYSTAVKGKPDLILPRQSFIASDALDARSQAAKKVATALAGRGLRMRVLSEKPDHVLVAYVEAQQ
jgi:hypothetical protein